MAATTTAAPRDQRREVSGGTRPTRPPLDWMTAFSWGAVAVSWVILAIAGTRADGAHHGAVDASANLAVASALALSAWTVMIVAMMLPSTIPTLRLFRTFTGTRSHRAPAAAAFTMGYVAVWTAFGVLALAVATALHHARLAVPWLESHWWLATAVLVAAAGAFQFTPLRERCLHVCRHPFAYLLHRHRPGLRGAFRTGAGHGVFCLGCCWALMLLVVAVGLTNLAWMGLLTAVMVYEKIGRRGDQAARLAGVALLAGAVVIAGIGISASFRADDRPAAIHHQAHDHSH